MDYSEYHPDWKDIIRPSILSRDEYKCRICGIKHKSRVYKASSGSYVSCDEFIEEWAKNSGRRVFTLILQVAHINHDKADNSPDNLISLCPRHHAKMDADHKKTLRITYRDKVKESKHKQLSAYVENRNQFLKTITDEIKQLTNVRIEQNEAEHIYTLISNFIQNVKN